MCQELKNRGFDKGIGTTFISVQIFISFLFPLAFEKIQVNKLVRMTLAVSPSSATSCSPTDCCVGKCQHLKMLDDILGLHLLVFIFVNFTSKVCPENYTSLHLDTMKDMYEHVGIL